MGSFTLSSPSQTLTFAFMAAYTTCIYCSLSMIRDPNHCSEFNLCYIMSIQDIVKSLSLDNYTFSVLSAKKSWFHSKSAMPLKRVAEQTYKDCRFVSSMAIVFVSYFCKYFTISTFKKNEFFCKNVPKSLTNQGF